MITQSDIKIFQDLAPLPAPAFPVQGLLYFLDGHYLFRRWEEGKVSSKFVTAADLAAAFSHSEQDSGWLVAGIVRVGSSARGPWYVYSAPAQKVTICLGEDETLTIPIPRTVMLGVSGEYFIWAAKEKYFDPKASGQHAPFPNVYPGGKICWGQNKPPQAEPAKARGVWELFFGSLFNADLATDKSRAHSGDVRLMLRSLAEKDAKTYPAGDLVSMHTTIANLIEHEIREQR